MLINTTSLPIQIKLLLFASVMDCLWLERLTSLKAIQSGARLQNYTT